MIIPQIVNRGCDYHIMAKRGINAIPESYFIKDFYESTDNAFLSSFNRESASAFERYGTLIVLAQ
jgi:hypothetical protein